jgi:hypothetical protein
MEMEGLRFTEVITSCRSVAAQCSTRCTCAVRRANSYPRCCCACRGRPGPHWPWRLAYVAGGPNTKHHSFSMLCMCSDIRSALRSRTCGVAALVFGEGRVWEVFRRYTRRLMSDGSPFLSFLCGGAGKCPGNAVCTAGTERPAKYPLPPSNRGPYPPPPPSNRGPYPPPPPFQSRALPPPPLHPIASRNPPPPYNREP